LARLYSNENFPLRVVAGLRHLGHDVLTVLEAGKAEQSIPDDEVLSFATAQDRAVLTMNRRHFMRLHREQRAHAGIIVCTFDRSFAGLAARIAAEIEAAGDLRERLLRVYRV
jgi:hypothetical protein